MANRPQQAIRQGQPGEQHVLHVPGIRVVEQLGIAAVVNKIGARVRFDVIELAHHLLVNAVFLLQAVVRHHDVLILLGADRALGKPLLRQQQRTELLPLRLQPFQLFHGDRAGQAAHIAGVIDLLRVDEIFTHRSLINLKAAQPQQHRRRAAENKGLVSLLRQQAAARLAFLWVRRTVALRRAGSSCARAKAKQNSE